jgi:hypothetical protein
MGHHEGSRKQKVHELYDKQGDAAAYTLGMKLKLKQSTLLTWISKWRTASVQANLARAKAKAKARVAKVKVAA